MSGGALGMFLELAAIASPPGNERAVADRVIAELGAIGLDVEEDDAGSKIDSTIGNLLCRLPGRSGGTPIFLCAHLDTVPPQGPLQPVVGEDGFVRNSGGTILGADNKSAVVAMIEAARRIVEEGRPHAGVELLFTPKEEVGLLGAGAFDHTRLEAELGFVYDQAAPIGDVIMGAPSQRSLLVRFHGRPAHSGMVPEEGRSAIVAAAKAIADLRLGRIDEETTANVGLNLLLIPRYGLVGAATATVIAEGLVILLGYWILARSGLRLPVSPVVPSLLAAGAMALVLQLAGVTGNLMVAIVLGAAVYVIALWSMRGIPADIREAVSQWSWPRR